MWDFFGGQAFAVLIGSLLVAWANFWFHSPQKKRKREFLTFLGTTVSIVGAFSSTHADRLDSGHNLGRVCFESIQDRQEDRRGAHEACVTKLYPAAATQCSL